MIRDSIKAGLFAVASVAVLSTSPAGAQDRAALQAIIDGEHRSEANRARDVYRNPLDTLTYFGVEPHHTVIEIYPGGGWYTEILAPYLREEGELIAAGYPRDPEVASPLMQDLNASYAALLESRPDLYDKVEVVDLFPRELSLLAPPESVDVILDFRNAHNWLGWGAENMLSAWYGALKSGGIVGIVDHRMDPDREAGNGYIHEKTLIDVMEEHGFRYMGSSEINANPLDTKDHPGGVWNLPPNLREVPENEREKYLAIGESDRMTMLFSKK